MAEMPRCPTCGGPGKMEVDWVGVARVRCDAYVPCIWDEGRRRVADEQEAMFDGTDEAGRR